MNNDYLKETKELNKQSAQKAGTSANAAPNMTNISYGATLEEVKQQNANSATNAASSSSAMNNSMNDSMTNNAMTSSTSISNDANVLAKVKQENAKSEMNKGNY